MKKKNTDSNGLVCSDNFVQINGYRLPRNCKIVIMDFRMHNEEDLSCCNGFQIFDEVVNKRLHNLKISENDNYRQIEDYNEIESTDTITWYQSSYVMKGFKDCIVSGSSITNKWLEL